MNEGNLLVAACMCWSTTPSSLWLASRLIRKHTHTTAKPPWQACMCIDIAHTALQAGAARSRAAASATATSHPGQQMYCTTISRHTVGSSYYAPRKQHAPFQGKNLCRTRFLNPMPEGLHSAQVTHTKPTTNRRGDDTTISAAISPRRFNFARYTH